MTLKFRHPDRYVAESPSDEGRNIDTKAKFEEDIKAPFVSLYSFSTSGRVGRKTCRPRSMMSRASSPISRSGSVRSTAGTG